MSAGDPIHWLVRSVTLVPLKWVIKVKVLSYFFIFLSSVLMDPLIPADADGRNPIIRLSDYQRSHLPGLPRAVNMPARFLSLIYLAAGLAVLASAVKEDSLDLVVSTGRMFDIKRQHYVCDLT